MEGLGGGGGPPNFMAAMLQAAAAAFYGAPPPGAAAAFDEDMAGGDGGDGDYGDDGGGFAAAEAARAAAAATAAAAAAAAKSAAAAAAAAAAKAKAEAAAEDSGYLQPPKFAAYEPVWTRGPEHPTPLVEPTALKSVRPPPFPPGFKLALPDVLLDGMRDPLTGAVTTPSPLSRAQQEAVAYAAARHLRRLPDGTRAGYFIGDGTGTGKGRMIAGIIVNATAEARAVGRLQPTPRYGPTGEPLRPPTRHVWFR